MPGKLCGLKYKTPLIFSPCSYTSYRIAYHYSWYAGV